MAEQWGPFEKLADSPYCSKSELCGGAVTVSFSSWTPLHSMVLVGWLVGWLVDWLVGCWLSVGRSAFLKAQWLVCLNIIPYIYHVHVYVISILVCFRGGV
jgi:hypothetical protein